MANNRFHLNYTTAVVDIHIRHDAERHGLGSSLSGHGPSSSQSDVVDYVCVFACYQYSTEETRYVQKYYP